jgi:hypothetical protein
MRDNLLKLFAIGMLCYVIFGIIFIINKNERCDEHIVLDDDKQYDCKSVTTFANGLSTINLCDGTRITIPTDKIKVITDIKE